MSRRKLLLTLVGLCSFVGGQALAQSAPDMTPEVHRYGPRVRREDDLHAVGLRKIGSKGFGNWFSIEQEADIGRDCARLLERNSVILVDPVVSEYINRIAQNLVRNSDAKVPFIVKVIKSDEINAYALPGGFLYVNTALIMAAQDEAELAAVMAHEIAHVAAHHAARQMTRSQLVTLFTLPVMFVGGPFGMAIEQAAQLAGPFTSTRFSRHFEREADYLGVEYMYLAGYDPEAFISLFERLQKLETDKPHTLTKIFAMHPQTADRIRKTQSEIARILPPRDLYITDTSEFDSVKLRLAELTSQRDREQQLGDRPTLRRRTAVEQDDSGTNEASPD